MSLLMYSRKCILQSISSSTTGLASSLNGVLSVASGLIGSVGFSSFIGAAVMASCWSGAGCTGVDISLPLLS